MIVSPERRSPAGVRLMPWRCRLLADPGLAFAVSAEGERRARDHVRHQRPDSGDSRRARAPSSSSGASCVDRVDAVVIGAGVVGLAVARALAMAGREVVILEAEDAIGTHTSSRNSEVIHAGIYYPQGSLKARACVEGRQRLYAYCAERGVPHRRCGKLIVATDAAQLERAGGHPTESARQRRHRCRAREPGAGSRDGTGVALRGGPALALDRDHRQPRADARLPGRCRTRGCDARVEEPARRRAWCAPTASSCTSRAPSRSLPRRW